MHKYLNIIAAVDFSTSSNHVISNALSLARQYCANITILNVVEYTTPMDADYIVPPVNNAENKLVEKAYERLDVLLNSMGESSIERIVTTGQPKHEILRIAEQKQADLLVVGAHRRHGISDMLGSTTDRVAHRAHCDVLIVRHPTS